MAWFEPITPGRVRHAEWSLRLVLTNNGAKTAIKAVVLGSEA
jgi:hypothetical protein